MNNVIEIKSGEKDYNVEIVLQDSISAEIEALKKRYRKVVILADRRVKSLYPNMLDYSSYDLLELDATEDQKSFHSLENIFDFYQRVGLQKKDVVVAYGGGIIQDIVALTTKVYWRGVDYFLVPTTLLSMSDSSIGAKCGINYKDRKNQIAVFSSPMGVLQNLKFLDTLDEKDIISGVGEIVKLLITSNIEDFEYLEENISDALVNRENFAELIYRSLISKKNVIEEDEYESDLRRILNYGHTLGHAAESLSNFSIPHGIAVLWGMDIMNYVALKRGLTSESVYKEIHRVILSIHDIGNIKISDPCALVDFVKNDKKVEGTKINIVYPKVIGNLVITPIELDDQLVSDVRSYLDSR